MVNIRFLLYVAAVICFIVAAVPTKLRVRFEWLAAACLVLAQIV